MYEFTHLPAPVQAAARLFQEGGEAAWLVGGATRDVLRGRPVKDFDFVIAGDGLRWGRRIAKALGGTFVTLDALRHVGRVVIPHEGKPLWIDVARFRGEADTGDGASLDEDLRLRDFTINAIALDPVTGDVVDPTGGVADLRAGILRASSPRVLEADPLRILRAVRLQATHGLTIDPATRTLMEAAAPGLARVAAERIHSEWLRLLAPEGARARVMLLDEVGALGVILPELMEGKGVTQSPPHSHDVFDHNLLVLEAIEGLWPWVPEGAFWVGPLAPFAGPMAAHLQTELGHDLPRWLLLKHVALLHDIGKPATRTVGKDGRIHFYGHDRAGAAMIVPLMRRLTFSVRSVEYAEQVIAHHLRPLGLSQHLPPSHRAIYRFFRDLKDDGPDVALHSIADQRGKAFATDRAEVVTVVARLLEAYFEEGERYVRPTPLLDGNAIMALTGARGPLVGKLLEHLREQQAQGHVTTREEAERAVRAYRGDGGRRDEKR